MLLTAIWGVFIAELWLDVHLRQFGVRPRTAEGLMGIAFYPLLHSGWEHLFNNSVTAFVLLFGVFSFYGRLGWQVLLWSWIMSGLWIWIAARDGNHIGFSGIIYALASFVFFAGLFRRYFRLMALSGVVVFLYGSMVWGIFPINSQISWEGHLFGAVAGLILAYYFKEKGPQRPKYSWEIEEEQGVDPAYDNIPWQIVPKSQANPENSEGSKTSAHEPPKVNYVFRQKRATD